MSSPPPAPTPAPGPGEHASAARLTRRTVLGGTLAAGLTACGGPAAEGTGAAGATPTGGGVASATTTASPPGPGASRTPSPSASASGTPLAAASAVPVGGGIVLAGEKLVLTQPERGRFKAFSAVCTHQGCTVAKVTETTISCPCHGAEFSAADGSVQGGPARGPLAETKVTVQDGQILKA